MTNQIQAPWDAPTPALPPELPKIARLDKLRSKFPAASVGKLPRVTCKACRDRACNEHRKQQCRECGSYMTTAHVHLDYVGHAEVTDRLLSVDPEWDWMPLSIEDNGLPRFVRSPNGDPVGLWIRLTVCGVTRLGYGSVDRGAFDAEKQLIGDALRNAAMRFGVALDLWSKNELESTLEADAPAAIQSQAVVAAAVEDPVWDPKPVARAIKGVPITIPDTWEMIRSLPIKGKGPYSKMLWGELDGQQDPSEFTRWLEAGVAKVILDHNAAVDAGRSHVPLPAEQRPLIAFQHLMDLRAGTIERQVVGDDDGTVPLTEEEMAKADEKRAGGVR